MATAQLSGRHSLRDVASNLTAQVRKPYHLGIRSVSRSSLSRVNASQPCSARGICSRKVVSYSSFVLILGKLIRFNSIFFASSSRSANSCRVIGFPIGRQSAKLKGGSGNSAFALRLILPKRTAIRMTFSFCMAISIYCFSFENCHRALSKSRKDKLCFLARLRQSVRYLSHK